MEVLIPGLMRELSPGMTGTALYMYYPLALNASPREGVHLQHKDSKDVKSCFPPPHCHAQHRSALPAH